MLGYLLFPAQCPPIRGHPLPNVSKELHLSSRRIQCRLGHSDIPFSKFFPLSESVTGVHPGFLLPLSPRLLSLLVGPFALISSYIWVVSPWLPTPALLFSSTRSLGGQFPPPPSFYPPGLFSSLSPCMLFISIPFPIIRSTKVGLTGPQSPRRQRLKGYLHSDLPQALRICWWPQTSVSPLMDGHGHPPKSLNQTPRMLLGVIGIRPRLPWAGSGKG